MPKIQEQYTPVPTVTPEMKPTPQIRETFPEVRYTKAVGEALEHVGRAGYESVGDATIMAGRYLDGLGRSVAGAGDELWKRAVALKELDNDKEAKQALVQHQHQQGLLTADFESKAGDAAGPAAYSAFLKQSADLQKSIENSLSNEDVKRRFRAESMGTLGREAFWGARHSASQHRQAVVGASEAYDKMQINEMGKSETEEEYESAKQKLEDNIRNNYGPAKGLKDDSIDLHVMEEVSHGIAMKSMNLANTDPKRGMDFLQKHQQEMDQRIYLQAYHSIVAKRDDAGERNIANRANANWDLPLEERAKIVRELAERDQPGNTNYRDGAMAKMKIQDIEHNREQKEVKSANDGIIKDALYGFKTPDRKPPTSDEELTVDPKVRAAWDSMTDTEKNKYRLRYIVNARGGYLPSAAGDARYRELHGMAGTQPSVFREMDLTNEHITNQQLKTLQDQQDAINKQGVKATEDPQLKHAMGVLIGSGILPEDLRTWRNPKLRNEFSGALRDVLVQETIKEKRPLKEAEIVKIGRDLLTTSPGTQWFGIGGSYTFETLMEEKIADEFRAHYEAQGFNEEEIRDIWVRSRYIEAFEAAKPKPKGAK